MTWLGVGHSSPLVRAPRRAVLAAWLCGLLACSDSEPPGDEIEEPAEPTASESANPGLECVDVGEEVGPRCEGRFCPETPDVPLPNAFTVAGSGPRDLWLLAR